MSEDPLEQNSRTLDHANIATERISHSLIHCVQAYLSSKPNVNKRTPSSLILELHLVMLGPG